MNANDGKSMPLSREKTHKKIKETDSNRPKRRREKKKGKDQVTHAESQLFPRVAGMQIEMTRELGKNVEKRMMIVSSHSVLSVHFLPP